VTPVPPTGILNIGGETPNAGKAGTINAVAVNGMAGHAFINFNQTDSTEFRPDITQTGTGTLTVTQSGTGKTILMGNNTYRGNTVIERGTLALVSTTNNIASSGTIIIANGATFDVSGVTLGFSLAAGQKLLCLPVVV